VKIDIKRTRVKNTAELASHHPIYFNSWVGKRGAWLILNY